MAGAVGAVDADGGIDAESAGALPGEHVVYGVLIEEVTAPEEAQDAALESGRLVGGMVSSREQVDGRVGEVHLVVDLGQDAVEDHEVEVEVGVEARAEAVKEGDGAELGVRGGAVSAGRRAIRMARRRIRSTAPASAGSWWKKGRIRFGTESTSGRGRLPL